MNLLNNNNNNNNNVIYIAQIRQGRKCATVLKLFIVTEVTMGDGCDWELIIDIIEFLVELALAVLIFPVYFFLCHILFQSLIHSFE